MRISIISRSSFRALLLVFVMVCALSEIKEAKSEIYPPGTFTIDGIPVNCGAVSVVLDPYLPDIGMADGMGHIALNRSAFIGPMPTPLKMYWFGHECGHYIVGANEAAADCWAVKTGRNQGWFRPQDFQFLIEMFRNNPGDMTHPSGPWRVTNMMQCYASFP